MCNGTPSIRGGGTQMGGWMGGGGKGEMGVGRLGRSLAVTSRPGR